MIYHVMDIVLNVQHVTNTMVCICDIKQWTELKTAIECSGWV